MNNELKKFIIGVVLFTTGVIGSGLNLISNSITLQAGDNNFIPFVMFILTLSTTIVGLVLMLKRKNN